MNWFTRHINWTYILIVILATFLFFAFVALINSSGANEENLYGLGIFLDEACTREWGGSNIPDLEHLTWGLDNENGESWECATLTVYLDNKGPYDLKIDTSGYKDLSHVTPGWGVSSDTLNLNQGERSPLDIKVSHHKYIDVYYPMIYFSVEPLETGSNWISYIIWIVVLLLAAGWLLYQKKRNYAWLLLSLSGIGIIILLCLENKRNITN